jgi:hypothetical protein
MGRMLRLIRLLSGFLRSWSNRYRPEKHYMRGRRPVSKS